MRDYTASLDIGGTNLRAALVGSDGQIVRSLRRPILERSPADVLSQISTVLAELGPEAKDAPLGVGFAAMIESPGGIVVNSPNLGWLNVPFGDMLRDEFGQKVRLLNDLNAITIGEAQRGAGQGADNVICVFVGTGVGMGAIVQGQLLEGAAGMATELGHTKIDSVEHGRACGCGSRGCLETYTAGRYLPGLAEDLLSEFADPSLRRWFDAYGPKLNSTHIEAAVKNGNPLAIKLWGQIAARLGRSISSVVAVTNPSVVVLGGGVLFGAPGLSAKVKEEILLLLSELPL